MESYGYWNRFTLGGSKSLVTSGATLLRLALLARGGVEARDANRRLAPGLGRSLSMVPLQDDDDIPLEPLQLKLVVDLCRLAVVAIARLMVRRRRRRRDDDVVLVFAKGKTHTHALRGSSKLLPYPTW